MSSPEKARANLLSSFRVKYGREPSRGEAYILEHGSQREIIETFTDAKIGADIGAEERVGSHAWARGIVKEAFVKALGRKPSEREIQAVQAIAFLETKYGQAWSGAMKGSKNWGAVQASKPKIGEGGSYVCPIGTAPHGDSDPNIGKYVTCFRVYETDVDGAADLIKVMFGRKPAATRRGPTIAQALKSGNIDKVSAAMWVNGYYGGVKEAVRDRISDHASAIEGGVKASAKAQGIKPAIARKGLKPNDVAFRLMKDGRAAGGWDGESILKQGWFNLKMLPAKAAAVNPIFAIGAVASMFLVWKIIDKAMAPKLEERPKALPPAPNPTTTEGGQ